MATDGSGDKAMDLRRAVNLTVSGDTEVGRFEVSDNGHGPSDAVRETLFNALVTDKPQGSGLGLTASRDVITRHSGELRWYRDKGWTRFIAEIPVAGPESPDATDAKGAASATHGSAQQQPSAQDSQPPLPTSAC